MSEISLFVTTNKQCIRKFSFHVYCKPKECFATLYDAVSALSVNNFEWSNLNLYIPGSCQYQI